MGGGRGLAAPLRDLRGHQARPHRRPQQGQRGADELPHLLYDAGEPLVRRAQEAGELRDDATIGDVIRMVSGIAGVAFEDDAQRDRVIAMAVDGLRAR
ncbi:hypothetical protein ACRAWB_10115 [Leifsonia poae]|uniref:SbtR family transcriptional regulator n=1 Tax=Leifsonia poae TaxID=110933 RepID=UPI003D69152C